MIIECHSKDFMFNKDFTMCTVKQCHEFACAHCAFFSSLWCTSSFSPQLFYRPNSKLCRFLLVCNLQHQKHRPMMIDQSLSSHPRTINFTQRHNSSINNHSSTGSCVWSCKETLKYLFIKSITAILHKWIKTGRISVLIWISLKNKVNHISVPNSPCVLVPKGSLVMIVYFSH